MMDNKTFAKHVKYIASTIPICDNR
ncbi:unnamed protein product, partial [Rotaria sp. Silwood1]